MRAREYTYLKNLQKIDDATKILRELEIGDELETGVHREEKSRLLNILEEIVVRISLKIFIEEV